MTRILVTGLKEPAGGVENAILAYTENFDNENFSVDFVFMCPKVSFSDRISGNEIYLPSRIKHPIKYRKEIKRILKDGNYNAVWCNYSGLTNIDFLKYAKKFGVKKRIAHAHTSQYAWGNTIAKYLVPFFHQKNLKCINKYATDFWACSKKSAEFMYGPKIADETKIIPNAVNTDAFIKNVEIKQAVFEEFNIPQTAKVIGHVGRMCTAKNQCFLLDIMKKINELDPNVYLLFIGDGELNNVVTGHAKEIDVKNVIFTGSRSDVPRLTQAMDVFLLPSLTEGFPVTVIEAQAADLPVVVSSEAVVKETNITGTVKYISLNASLNEWATACLDAIGSPCSNCAEKLKEAGYDCKTQAKKLEAFFKGVA